METIATFTSTAVFTILQQSACARVRPGSGL